MLQNEKTVILIKYYKNLSMTSLKNKGYTLSKLNVNEHLSIITLYGYKNTTLSFVIRKQKV